jgi:hypothetical protein
VFIGMNIHACYEHLHYIVYFFKKKVVLKNAELDSSFLSNALFLKLFFVLIT